MKKVVVIGGGTGTYTVLRGLKNFLLDLVAVVSMADDGGSSGRLIDEYGVLPPGDIRRGLVALAESDEILKRLFEYRFDKGGLKGHSFGNLFLTSLREILGSDKLAIKEASRILKIKGKVLPVTLDHIRLCAELEDGQMILGETNINIPKHDANLRIKRVFLSPKARANSDVITEIGQADLIVIGPGDLYTSIIPNLLVEGLSNAIRDSNAKKVYVCNLMTKHGETDKFRVCDFVREVENYLGKDSLDFVLYEDGNYNREMLSGYAKEKAFKVMVDEGNFKNFKAKFLKKNLSIKEKLIRHDSEKLARGIVELL